MLVYVALSNFFTREERYEKWHCFTIYHCWVPLKLVFLCGNYCCLLRAWWLLETWNYTREWSTWIYPQVYFPFFYFCWWNHFITSELLVLSLPRGLNIFFTAWCTVAWFACVCNIIALWCVQLYLQMLVSVCGRAHTYSLLFNILASPSFQLVGHQAAPPPAPPL